MQWTEFDMRTAYAAVKAGLPIRKAARRYAIPYTTLRGRLAGFHTQWHTRLLEVIYASGGPFSRVGSFSERLWRPPFTRNDLRAGY